MWGIVEMTRTVQMKEPYRRPARKTTKHRTQVREERTDGPQENREYRSVTMYK